MPRFSKHFVVAALMVSIGLHWAVLQSAAWMGMAVTYTMQKGSLVEGLSDTFDGAHPCPLCKMVEKGQEKNPNGQDQTPPAKDTQTAKLILALVSVPKFVFTPAMPSDWIMTSIRRPARQDPPVTPPPKLGACV